MTSCLGGEAYALSKMVDHTLLLEGFYAPLECMNPGVAGLEDWGSLFTHLKTEEMVAEKYLVRQFFVHPTGLGRR